MDKEQKIIQKLEDALELLKNIRGRHTQLVTVMIPAGGNKDLTVRQLESEKGTASNIKSKQTRSAVEQALERIIRELKLMKATPENGLALFAGNVSEKEGVEDIQLWMLEMPKPLRVKIYRCDQVFMTEPLEEMLKVDEVYGLLVIDRKDATIGLLEGRRIKKLQHMSSGVPGKIKAGGQSSQRFARITENLAKEFFRKVAEEMKLAFFEMKNLKGILVGGPIPTKEEFLVEGQLVTKLKEKVIAVKDLGYTDEHGLKLLVEASHEDIAQQEIVKEQKIIEKFLDTLGKSPERAAYGEEKIRLALTRGAVGELLIAKDLPRDTIKEFEKLADDIGAEIHLISNDNVSAEQFHGLTKGMGAILRFSLE